jgi:hypothetical protein
MIKKFAGKKLPLINEEGEVRELTREDMTLFKPAKEVLPASLLEKLSARPPKIQKLER